MTANYRGCVIGGRFTADAGGRRLLLVLLIAALALSGCGGDDGDPSTNPTATPEVPEPLATPTPTIDFGQIDTPAPTAPPMATSTPLQPCPTAVAAQCATDCSTFGGCCAVPAPGSGAYACFDPAQTGPPNWVGDTPCGTAPGDDPSKACIVDETPTPTETPTPGGPTPTPNDCPGGNGVSFTNNNPYPIWLAEAYQGSGSLSANTIVPPAGDWMIESGESVDLCLPSGWSGRFWPRTECRFEEYFGYDQGYVACTAASECSAGHICYGGRCMLDCSTGGASFCQGTTGLDNEQAICVSSAFGGAAKFCSYAEGVVCKTGDCQGLYQCYGVWDTYTASYGATGPVSLFELTSNGPTNVNYDVSLVSGFNSVIAVQPSEASCYAPTCVADLNAACPAPLQLAGAPSSTPGPVPCGNGTSCQSGTCVGDDTCVFGCNDPSDQCAASSPSALQCDAEVPGGGGATYFQMYATKGPGGETMISGNQGTPTCWGTIDCLPTQVCNMTAIANFPSGVGICLPSDGSVPQPQPNCATQSDVGNACGGYSTLFTDAMGYICVKIGDRSGDVACVPPYDPPVSGYGTLITGTDGTTKFYSGVGAPLNPVWYAAALVAGGGTTPWYETFSNTCPHQYGWTYDDNAGGFDCTTGGAALGFSVGFGLPQATPTPAP